MSYTTPAQRITRATSNAFTLVHRFRQRELTRASVKDVVRAHDAAQPANPNAKPAIRNPFVGQRDPKTGRWMQPKYSLRRQAELVKAAKLSGTLHLLPPGPKLRPIEVDQFKQIHALATRIRNKIPPKRMAKNAAMYDERAAAAPKPAEYEREVKWTGRVWGRQAKGWKTGTRLYARKQFMFKGHAWEKVINLRRKFISLRLRSQKRRIRRWHASRVGHPSPFAKVKRTARIPY